MSASIHNDYSGLEKFFRSFRNNDSVLSNYSTFNVVFCFTGVLVQLKNLFMCVLVPVK